MLATDLEAINN